MDHYLEQREKKKRANTGGKVDFTVLEFTTKNNLNSTYIGHPV